MVLIIKSSVNQKSLIMTRRELEVIAKRLRNEKLTQQDSNYLSKFVRPKLKEISLLNAKEMLNDLEYNQKAISIERRIRKLIKENIKSIDSVILFGSVVQNSYQNYNDIDILIIAKVKFWKNLKDKYNLTSLIQEQGKGQGLNLDIQILSKEQFYSQYYRNPSLIYQLKDHKIIYGKLNLSKKIEVNRLLLRMKLDWSEVVDSSSEGNEIYHALRNTILVRLLMNRIVDNKLLVQNLIDQLGEKLIVRLRDNIASKKERTLALKYLKYMTYLTRKEIINSTWEKLLL